ncbi:MAG: U32 family peptidase [Bacteroidales bacterium]|nr:U32 family peptidase [Bacteroidales bacterium]
MAPVGSFESLRAAIQGGADSVYFGIEQLNMRANSSNNFTIEDLREIVHICKENGLKSYLTMNTVLYDHDIRLMQRIIDAAHEEDVTAIIASDIAVIQYAYSKGMELHMSTQLNISNIEAVKFFSQYADVMVLARELNLKQVKAITDAINNENITGPSGELVKIEIFAHGALCMAISGKCYLSLHEQNSSANRGACLQTCRKPYIVTEKESGVEFEVDNEYIMSAKDLNTIPFLDKVLEAGITVLKIEGRGRPGEYVKTVCRSYDEAIKAYLAGEYNQDKVKEWEAQQSTVFNRGFWDGYYMGRKIGEWSEVYGSKATKKKVYIGKGTNYFSKIQVAEFLAETGDALQVGDEIIITGPTTGVIETKVEEIQVDRQTVEKTVKGELFSIRIDEIVRRSDKIYKLVDTEFAVER